MERTIDLTGVDLVALAKKAYELSVPQRMGFLHYTANQGYDTNGDCKKKYRRITDSP